MSLSSLQDFDNFFYYGLNDLQEEVKSDIMTNIMQPLRSLFYDRSNDAAGIKDFENKPNIILLNIEIPRRIVTSLFKRNLVVSNGSDGYPDRRVITSQSIIRVDDERGLKRVSVQYIGMADLKQKELAPLTFGITI